jgi:hypothetical protein
VKETTVGAKAKSARRDDRPGKAEHVDQMLDEALRQTFPASDAIAIMIELPGGSRSGLGVGSGSRDVRK